MDVSLLLPSTPSQEGRGDEAEQNSVEEQNVKARLLEEELAVAMENRGKP